MILRRIFVCFIGTDGSGKSTLVENLHHTLKARNFKVKRVYGRYQPLLTKFLMKIGKRLFLANANRSSDYEHYLKEKRLAFKELSFLGRIFLGLVVVEYYFEVLFKIALPYRLGYSIIADRYAYDTVINDIAVDKNLSLEDVAELIHKFWRFVPKPQIGFLVQVPEEVALKRKNDIPSAAYLRVRNQYYMHLARSEGLIVLDGTRHLAELEDDVMKNISRLIQPD